MSDVFRDRRARVLDMLGAGHALVLAAAPELRAGTDGEIRYLPDADLYYLTGYTEPEAVLVLCAAAEQPYTLFVRPRDADRERWTGARGGVEAGRTEYGADAAHAIEELGGKLPALVGGATTLYTSLDQGRPDVDAAVRQMLASARRTRPRTGMGPHTVIDPRVLLAPMRLRKDADEVQRMRAAADITVASFSAVAATVRDAEGEWQVEATLEHAFRTRGATGPAFPSIVAGGVNATVLHYTANTAPLQRDALVLLDGGARHRMYCADVTRTLPVGGRFVGVQRAVYDIVLAAHAAALRAIAPGAPVSALHDAAIGALVDGMRQLGLLRGSTDEIMEQKQYRRYYPHQTSHWIGLDVHDVGDYVHGTGEPVLLEPGMTLTVEPGLYVPVADEEAPASLRGLGLRLEDDVLVTDLGSEVLTRGLPIRPDDVETMMA
ncbi:MAG: aminopeptidase P N-terminal domain-containing protein [Gemmatimonadota bacterium]